MPAFNYKARDEQGKLVEGYLDAPSEDELGNRLRKMGYMPVTIAESSGKSVSEEENPQGISKRRRVIKAEDMIIFNMQLSSMINAGVTLLNSLNIIHKQTENRKLADVIKQVINSVAGGLSLSESLAMHPKVFSNLYVSLIRAGEVGGTLDKVLTRLANYLEEQEDLRQKIQGAMFYPIILMAVGLIVILLIVTFVMPKFIQIFDKAGVVLPLPTRILYNFGVVIKQFWYLVILGIYLLFAGTKWYIASPKGKIKFDRFILQLPIIGPLTRKVIVSRFSRTLATLVDSGVSMLYSLELVKDVVGNEIFAQVILNVRKSVERGERLDQPLKMSKEFPPDAVQMITVGEETGKLGAMLNKVADFYDTSIKYSVRRLTTLIEPIFISIMGVVVGVIMAAMILPLFDMVKTLRA